LDLFFRYLSFQRRITPIQHGAHYHEFVFGLELELGLLRNVGMRLQLTPKLLEFGIQGVSMPNLGCLKYLILQMYTKAYLLIVRETGTVLFN